MSTIVVSARRLQRLPAGLPLGLVVFATAGGLALAGGGYGPIAWGLASLGLLWLLAVGLVLVENARLGRLEAVAFVSLAGLIAWTGASIWWSLDRAQSALEVQRGLSALAALAVALLFARRVTAAAVLSGLAAACSLASIVAVGRWLSAGAPLGLGVSGSVRYANALGLLAAMGLILALGFARRETTGRVGRLLAIGAAIVSAAALCLSASIGALVALALGLTVSLLLAGARRTAVASALGGVALAGAVVALAAGVIGPTSRSAEATARKTPTVESGGAASVSLEPRLRLWAVAWRSASDAPLVGAGAGSFGRIWLQHRPMPVPARDVHNLYLETLVELGIVGVILLLAALGAPLAAAVHARHHALAPPAAGAYAAFLAHAGIDADWESALLPAAALFCAGALLVMARPLYTKPRHPVAPRVVAFVTVLVLLGVGYTGVIGNAQLERSRNLAKVGALDAASVHARAALHWAPWSSEAWCVLGEAALARGQRDLAQARFARALDSDPSSWPCWRGMARASRGPMRHEAAQRAEALNPLGEH